MSSIERMISFPLAGEVAWRLGAPPSWRRFKPPLSALAIEDDPVVWSADFSGGAYLRNGAGAALAGMLACVRSSEALMQGTDAGFHSFGPDAAPVLPGIGLDVWGQFPSLLRSGNNPAAADWSNTGLSIVDSETTVLGIFNETILVSGGTLAARRVQNLVLTSGVPVSVSFLYKAGTSGRGRILLFGSGSDSLILRGVAGNLLGSTVVGGTLSRLVNSDLGGGIYCCSFTWTPSNPGTGTGVGIGPDSAVAGSTLVALGVDVVPASIPVPWISNAASSVTRLASDVAIHDFAALSAAHGLAAGFAGRDVVDLRRLSDAVPRTVWSRGTDADNRIALEIGTGNKVRLTVRLGGADVLTLETADGFATTGLKTIDYVCADGLWSLAATGLAGAVSAASVAVPALGVAHIGRNFGATPAYLNGAIAFSRIERTV